MTIAGIPTDVVRTSDFTWDSLANKPLVFPPSAHSHPISDLTGLGTGVAAALASAVSGTGGLASVTSPVFGGTVTMPSLIGSGSVTIGTGTGYNLKWDNNGLYSNGFAQPLGTVSNPWGNLTSNGQVFVPRAGASALHSIAWSGGITYIDGTGGIAYRDSGSGYPTKFSVSNAGTLWTNASIKLGGNTDEIVPSSNAGYMAITSNQGTGVYGTNAAKTVFKIIGTVSQTSPLFECQTNTPTTVFSVGPAGYVTTPRIQVTDTASTRITLTDSVASMCVGLYNGKMVLTSGQFTTSPLIMEASTYGGHFSDDLNVYGSARLNAEIAPSAANPAFQALMRGTPTGTERAIRVTSGATYDTERFAVDFNGVITSSGTGSVRSTFTRTGSGQNTLIAFTNTATSAYVGIGAANVFAASLGVDLTSSPPFQVNLSTGNMAVTGTLNATGFVATPGATVISTNSSGGVQQERYNGDWTIQRDVNGIRLGLNASLGFTGDNAFAPVRTRIREASSGVVEINNGTSGVYRDLLLRDLTASGTLGFSQSRFQQSAAQTLQTQVYDTTLLAWQETERSQASPSGAKWSIFGATPIVKQTLPAAATDAATTQSLCNAIRSLLVNFGFSN